MEHKLNLTETQLGYIAHLMDDLNESDGMFITVGDFSTDTDLCDRELIEFCKGRVASMGSDGVAEARLLIQAAVAVGEFLETSKTRNRYSLMAAQGRLLNGALDIANSLGLKLKLGITLEKEMI